MAALARDSQGVFRTQAREAALLELFFEAETKLRAMEFPERSVLTGFLLVAGLAASSEERFSELGSLDQIAETVLGALRLFYPETSESAALAYAGLGASTLQSQGWTEEARMVARGVLTFVPWTSLASLEIAGLEAGLAEDQGDQAGAVRILQEIEQELAEHGSTPSEEGKLLLFQARHALELGLFDLAFQRLSASEAVLRDAGTASVNLMLEFGELWLESEAFALLRAKHLRWESEAPALFSPATSSGSTLLLQAALATAELEREGELELSEVESRLMGCATLLLPKRDLLLARCALADLYLRNGRLGDCDNVLIACRELEQASNLPPGMAVNDLRVLELRALLARDATADIPESLANAIHAAAEQLLLDWSRTPSRRGGLGFLRSARRRQILSAAIEVTLRRGHGVEAALAWILRGQSNGGLAQEMGATATPNLKELRAELLGEDQAVVVILPGKLEGESHVFAFDDKRLAHVRIASRDRLRRIAERIESTLASASGRELAEIEANFTQKQLSGAGRALADQLLPPNSDVRTLVQESGRVVFVGAEGIAAFPPEALMLYEDRMLGVTHAVSSAVSLSVQLAIARRGKPEGGERSLVLLAGLRVPGEAAARFRVTDHEIAPERLGSLIAPFEGAHDLLAGEAVGKQGLLEIRQQVLGASVVHFLVHGVWVEGLERGAALLLAAAGEGPYDVLTADWIEQELRVRGLVILSACRGAEGPLRLGDDNWANLGGVFLRAGATGVVLSRNDLELSSTLDLMGRFHSHLAAGVTTDEALRCAREERAAKGLGLESLLDARVQLLGLSDEL